MAVYLEDDVLKSQEFGNSSKDKGNFETLNNINYFINKPYSTECSVSTNKKRGIQDVNLSPDLDSSDRHQENSTATTMLIPQQVPKQSKKPMTAAERQRNYRAKKACSSQTATT